PAAPDAMMSTLVRSVKLSAGVISSVVMLFLFAGARVADGNHALDRGARGIRSLLFDEYLILSLLQALEELFWGNHLHEWSRGLRLARHDLRGRVGFTQLVQHADFGGD